MPRRILLTLAPLFALAVLALAGQPAAAQDAGPFVAATVADESLSLWAQVLPPTASDCADLQSEEIQLVGEPVSLDAPGPRGRPSLCLLYREYDDIYRVVMLPIESETQFRAAKDAAIELLNNAGFDLCSIGGWSSYGARATGLTADDLFTIPAVCAPRVRTLAGDGQITAVIDEVRDAVLELALITAGQMAWQPNRTVTVMALMDTELAVDVYRRSVGGLPVAEVERRARAGRSVAGNDAFAGPRILLNFLRTAEAAQRRGQPLALEARLEATVFIAHEYAHIAQAGIGGSNSFFPLWFIEGQASWLEERNGGLRPSYREEAARLERMGRAVPLSQLSARDDWFAEEARAGSNAVYSRAFAAVDLLVEQYGFDATVQLLRDNKEGSIDRFNSLLATLTGQDLEGFDGALNSWLQGAPVTRVPSPMTTAPPPSAPPMTTMPPPSMPPTTAMPPATPPAPPVTMPPAMATTPAPPNARYSGTDTANRVRVEFTISSNGRVADGSLTVITPIPCGSGRGLGRGSRLTFQYPIRPDGGFAGSVPAGAALVTLDVRILGGAAEGTFTYTDPSDGCDTGRITFTAMRTP